MKMLHSFAREVNPTVIRELPAHPGNWQYQEAWITDFFQRNPPDLRLYEPDTQTVTFQTLAMAMRRVRVNL